MTPFKRVSYLLIFLFTISGSQTCGQEMLGSVFSTYGGINSAQINPAFITGSKTYIDINIISANAFLVNNWAYIPKEDEDSWEVVRSDSVVPKYGKYQYNGFYTYHKDTKPKNLAQSVRIMGPSVMLQTGEHAFGLSIQSRMITSGQNIPYEIPIFIYEGLTYKPLQNIVFDNDNFNFSSLVWTEISASWGYDFHRFYKSKLSFGLNAKLILGHEGAYSINRNAKYIIYEPETIEFFNYDAEYGMALPMDYNSKEPNYQGPLVRGYGLGIDAGFVFTRLKSRFPPANRGKICSKPYEEYLYRIGFSLLDIGGVSFNQNAQKHNFDNVKVYWAEFDTVEFHSLNIGMEQLSQAFYGDPHKSKTADEISIGLPAAVSLQFEGNFYKNTYIAALWIQPVQFNARQVRRPSQISIVPRYENSLFALSLPLTLLQYEYLSLGAAIRLGPLTVGTERLGVLVGVSDIDGMDIYFSLKFSLTKGSCSTRNLGACYTWNSCK